MVGLDTNLTPELKAEGLAREIIHRIQNVRKAAGLDIEDRIVTYVDGASDAVRGALTTHNAYVMQETLSTAINLGAPPADAHAEPQDIEGDRLTLAVVKA
jgi:isoleucyl-tRNA synthetase